MVKMNKLTDYGIVLMVHLAEEPGQLLNAADLAEHTHITFPTVSKILKQLQKHGLVVSTRGAHGGYRLAQPAEATSVQDIIIAMEGPIALTECTSDPGKCDQEPYCSTRSNWMRINQVIRMTLSNFSLAELTRPLPEKIAMTRMPARPARQRTHCAAA